MNAIIVLAIPIPEIRIAVREMRLRKEPIGRPRQVYIGENLRSFSDIKSR